MTGNHKIDLNHLPKTGRWFFSSAKPPASETSDQIVTDYFMKKECAAAGIEYNDNNA